MSELDVRYDVEGDALVAKEKEAEITKSVAVGDLTVDLDSDERVIGIQMLNASEVMEFSGEVSSPTTFLENVEDASLRVKYQEDGVVVVLMLQARTEEGVEEAQISSMAPSVASA